ncbi:hypothetical protein D1872_319510 [compost metagenome]
MLRLSADADTSTIDALCCSVDAATLCVFPADCSAITATFWAISTMLCALACTCSTIAETSIVSDAA